MSLLLLPILLLLSGGLVAVVLVQLAKTNPLFDRPLPRTGLAVLLSPLIWLAGVMALAAVDYDGACSGWSEQGSHPCSRADYVFQDFELTLAFGIPMSLISAALAISFCRRLRSGP